MSPRRILAVATALLLSACDGGEKTYEIDEIRDLPRGAPIPPPVSSAERFGVRADDPHGSPSPSPISFTYDLPSGWQELPPAQFRDVNLRVGDSAETDCYVSVGAGGIAQNVDRWRKQFGQGPMDGGASAALPKKPFLGGEGALVDLEGTFGGMGGEAREGYRMIGLIRDLSGRTVTLKLVGPADLVGREVERFLAFAASLRAAAPPPPFDPSTLAWEAPKGWVRQGPKEMREVTFVPEGSTDTECWVTVLLGDGGGLPANLHRWRVELMGQPALTAAEVAALPTLEVLGRKATFVSVEGTYTGMRGDRIEKAGFLGILCPLGTHTVAVRMTGPAEVVRREKENFVAFCQSLR